MHSVELSHRTVILALSGASKQLREFAVVAILTGLVLIGASHRSWQRVAAIGRKPVSALFKSQNYQSIRFQSFQCYALLVVTHVAYLQEPGIQFALRSYDPPL